MAYYDRDYYREDQDGGGGLRRRFSGMSVTTWIIGINVVMFVLTGRLTGAARGDFASPVQWALFTLNDGVYGVQLWRWITYQFVHGDLLHLIFNMLWLFYLGRYVEQWFGSRRFLAFYLLCGCAGAAVYAGLAFVPGLIRIAPDQALVGASGAVLGLIIACAVLAPHQSINLWGVFTMTVRTLAYISLGLAVFSIAVAARDAGGEAAHLGGALMGFVLVKNPWALNWADAAWAHRVSPKNVRQKLQKNRWERKMLEERELEEEVDRILAKVARDGLHSLSRKEKKTLQQATERQRQG